ncbi:unnamed protein product [Ilex paraguariensis]|uniref:hAT-like transposase RNase-H fold domain-containing protein n=1 Tax=Ilex paraguariensis TaxID=185542 RepID=A0ABC8RDE6_9AQUA
MEGSRPNVGDTSSIAPQKKGKGNKDCKRKRTLTEVVDDDEDADVNGDGDGGKSKVTIILTSRCKKCGKVYNTDMVFDPRYKFQFVEWCYVELYGEGSMECMNVREELFALFDEYMGNTSKGSSSQTISSCPRSDVNQELNPIRKSTDFLKKHLTLCGLRSWFGSREHLN